MLEENSAVLISIYGRWVDFAYVGSFERLFHVEQSEIGCFWFEFPARMICFLYLKYTQTDVLRLKLGFLGLFKLILIVLRGFYGLGLFRPAKFGLV